MTLSFLSYKLDGTLAGNPTAGVIEYQHEHIEGPYVASFALESGQGGVDDVGLRAWFDNKLMTEFAATFDGHEVWRGLVWEMQLEMGGEIRVKSIEDMANAIKCRYTNTSGDVVHTGWQLHDESIIRYGRKERVVSTSNENTEEAEERAAVELQYSASPYTNAIAYRDTEKHRLLVTCVGRQVAANNTQLVTDTMRQFWEDGNEPGEDNPLYDISQLEYGDDTTVGDEARRIVEVINYNSDWLYALDMDANDTATAAGVSSNVGAFDRLIELAKLRDSDGNFYRLTVTNDGGVIYKQFEETVNYYRYPLPRGLENAAGEIPTWGAKPGIIKYVDSYGGPPLPDTWLSDKRLTFAERAVMRDGDAVATFHGRDLDATDIYRAVEANQRWIERNRQPAAAPQPKPKDVHYDIYGHIIP